MLAASADGSEGQPLRPPSRHPVAAAPREGLPAPPPPTRAPHPAALGQGEGPPAACRPAPQPEAGRPSASWNLGWVLGAETLAGCRDRWPRGAVAAQPSELSLGAGLVDAGGTPDGGTVSGRGTEAVTAATIMPGKRLLGRDPLTRARGESRRASLAVETRLCCVQRAERALGPDTQTPESR